MLSPFGLAEHMGLLQIPVVVTLGAAFFLIEKMAIHLQDPFENRPTDTPVTTIANTIEKNITQMLNEFQSEFDIINEFRLPEPKIQDKDPYFIL